MNLEQYEHNMVFAGRNWNSGEVVGKRLRSPIHQGSFGLVRACAVTHINARQTLSFEEQEELSYPRPGFSALYVMRYAVSVNNLASRDVNYTLASACPH